jgi:hypothetical protein
MLQQIQHKSRHASPSIAERHYTSPGSPAFGRTSTSTYQTQSQYPSYSPNAFADMVGSFSSPQLTHQMRSPWYSSPPAPQRYAPSSRHTATFTARSPPSPTNSSYTTTSSNTSSFSSQPGPSAAIGATHRPLASWTHGSNIWRKRLIGMSSDSLGAGPLARTVAIVQAYATRPSMLSLQSSLHQPLLTLSRLLPRPQPSPATIPHLLRQAR